MEIKLKPCPFCGERGRVRKLKNGYRIICEECGASSHCAVIQPWHDNKFVAQCQTAKAWNARVGERKQIHGANNLTCKEVCVNQGANGCEDCPVRNAIDRLAAYEDAMPLERAQDLAKAEKDGRLVVPPCKVGDTVYEANKRGFISTYKVISIHISECSVLIGWELIDGICSNLNGFEVQALGKAVFLTCEEAEAVLKKRKEADDEAD